MVNINIADSIFINNLTYCKRTAYGFDINIINIKGKIKTDYDYIYRYYRKLNDWYYNAGYNTRNSDKVRIFTERRRNSTFDNEKINLKSEVIILSNKITR